MSAKHEASALAMLQSVDLATCKGANSLLLSAAGKDLASVIEWLARCGVDVNARDEAGNTALHVACAEGSEAAAKMLLEWGADVNPTNNCDATPFQYASHAPLRKVS
mmetsp:Transcript_55388/g.120724  ORF Transcript_55388/g.120724 Transcript_55388/m.120724 type:complete len:107 (+) Transcript_55388:1267-1587(+)